MRASCPTCGSLTALGEIHCFKCGHVNSVYRFTDGFLIDLDIKSKNSILEFRKDTEFNPKKFAPKALMWLYKSFIYDDVILKQKIGYCTSINKVLLPAFNDELQLQFYQLRSLDENENKDCKYISYGKMKDYTIIYEDQTNSSHLVIVEDHLSAMRLRKHANVCCLSGTKFKPQFINRIVTRYDNFIFWLDPDKAGRDATFANYNYLKRCKDKYTQRLAFTGIGVDFATNYLQVDHKNVKLDPKKYLDSEIKGILQDKVIVL